MISKHLTPISVNKGFLEVSPVITRKLKKSGRPILSRVAFIYPDNWEVVGPMNTQAENHALGIIKRYKDNIPETLYLIMHLNPDKFGCHALYDITSVKPEVT